MKTIITDKDALATLPPLEVATYLRAKGWDRTSHNSGSSVWLKSMDGDSVEALLPLDSSMSDFSFRMAELLQLLATVEGRSESVIFTDLLTTNADVIRARIEDAELRDGSVPIEIYAQIAQRARDMMLAAACSATQRKAVWYASKPRQAIEQMRKVRMGQSERGSYVLSIVSRVSPVLHTPANGRLFETEAPFERQVTQMLATSLFAMNAAATEAAATGEFEAFQNAVELGVSANLCEAVAGFWDDDNRDRRVEFSFSWSPARPIDHSVPSSINFNSDRILVIREAARLMKEQSPTEDFLLEGAVVKLDRENMERPGKVTIIGLVDGKPKRVSLELSDPQYGSAIRAHESQLPFQCTGTLSREGRGYVLRDPRNVSVQEDQ